jgi:hypothetical protein
MAATPTTPATSAMIPVRLNLLVRIDPARWTAPAPGASDAPAFDLDKTVAALAALYGQERAKEMAAALAPKAPAEAGPAVVRSQVRDYMLRAVRDLDALKAAGATVADADRPAAR